MKFACNGVPISNINGNNTNMPLRGPFGSPSIWSDVALGGEVQVGPIDSGIHRVQTISAPATCPNTYDSANISLQCYALLRRHVQSCLKRLAAHELEHDLGSRCRLQRLTTA